MRKSTLLHLRIPFSIFLLPFFLFSSSLVEKGDGFWFKFWILFIVLHIFVYPASNGFNSYYDKDEGPIGGLKHPPKTEKELLYFSLLMDFFGIVLAAIYLEIWVWLLVLIYGLVSKAYSHPAVRLKSKPILGLLAVSLFQGGFVVLLTVYALQPQMAFEDKTWFAAGLASAMLMGSYPMTQIYQHQEDRKRGDITISLLLGIKGTFVFTMIFFGLTSAGFVLFFLLYNQMSDAFRFGGFLFPVLVYFFWWFYMSLKNEKYVNYENTMRLNLISSLILSLAFSILLLGY